MSNYGEPPQWSSTPIPPPPQQPPSRQRGAWWKSLWFVGVLAGIVGLLIGVAAGASGSSTDAKPAPTVTATVSTTATVEATVTTTPTVQKVVATKTKVRTVTYTPKPSQVISDGTYKVGRDIKAGEWRTDGEGDCYWARETSPSSGDIDAIIANDNIDGPSIVHVSTGEYLKLDGGCEWKHA